MVTQFVVHVDICREINTHSGFIDLSVIRLFESIYVGNSFTSSSEELGSI
jgi:hypothetical protein